MNRRTVRICVEVDGKPRELLSAREGNKDRVTLVIRSAEQCGHGDDVVVTKNHKISIPVPTRSKINTLIHMTQVLEDGKKKERHTVTDATQRDGCFSNIYFRQCTNFNRERYLIPPAAHKEPTIVVGTGLLSTRHNIVHAVLVGSANSSFGQPHHPHVRACEIKFNRLTLVVLLTSGLLPSDLEGTFSYCPTFRPEEFEDLKARAMMEELMKGVSPAQCCDEFWLAANLLLGAFVKKRFDQDSAQTMPQFRQHLASLHRGFASQVRDYAPKVREGFVQLHTDERYWSFSEE